MGSNAGDTRTVKTTDTVFAIVESLDPGKPTGVTELARELDLAPSTVHKHLATLVEKEYVVKEDHKYRLGLRFLETGHSVRRASPLYPLARAPIEELAAETGEVVWVIVEEHGYGVHVLKAVGDHGVQTHGEIGKRAHLHHLAAGKAILAHLPESRVDAILDRHGLPPENDNTITDREALLDDLAAVRERGYAYNDEETVRGLRSVGAPVRHEGAVVGALCVCGPARRMRGERYRETVPDALLGATNEIELKLSY